MGVPWPNVFPVKPRLKTKPGIHFLQRSWALIIALRGQILKKIWKQQRQKDITINAAVHFPCLKRDGRTKYDLHNSWRLYCWWLLHVFRGLSMRTVSHVFKKDGWILSTLIVVILCKTLTTTRRHGVCSHFLYFRLCHRTNRTPLCSATLLSNL